jgi:hypothetical protein
MAVVLPTHFLTHRARALAVVLAAGALADRADAVVVVLAASLFAHGAHTVVTVISPELVFIGHAEHSSLFPESIGLRQSHTQLLKFAITLTDPDFGRTNGASLRERLITTVVQVIRYRAS